MKKNNIKTKLAALALAATTVVPSLHAQLNITNADGSDGALIIGTNTVIDLSKAVYGSWTNTSASPGNGTYDPNQWAVVFKYSSVIISNGATLSFLNHSTHAPVVWLVNGNVTINGNLNLDGQPTKVDQVVPEPGPGGFRGGAGTANALSWGSGFGPGGGMGSPFNGTYSTTYGNQSIIPLIGGSGGNGRSNGSDDGGAGGGAILVAAQGVITINGTCHADGGSGAGNNSGSGSGGGIRLVANQILGTGYVEVYGGNSSDAAEYGWIRLEATNVTVNLHPPFATQGVTPSNTPTIFPSASAASISILSISNQTANLSAPADPKASMSNNPLSDDFTMVTTNTVTIRLQTVNFPTNGTVTVFIKPHNSSQIVNNATCISSNNGTAQWQLSNVNLPYPGHTVIQARASY